MNSSFEIKSSLLAKNVALNFIGQMIPLVIAVLTMPYVIHGLGPERFGILSIAWIVLGYFSMFDLGLGRSTTKFVAEALGKGETERISPIVWTSLISQLVLGIMGGIIWALITPFLVERVLNIPPELIGETRTTLYLLSFSILIIICSISLRGVLEAGQRFDLVNAVSIPGTSSIFIMTAAGIFFGFGLPGIVVLLIISRAVTALVYLKLCIRIYPNIRQVAIDANLLKALFTFGGWVTVCSIIGQIMSYADRFFIGMLLPIANVGYYSVSADMLTRLGALPGSFAKTLFPAFSSVQADQEKLKQLYTRSLKYILLVVGPVVVVFITFSEDLLHIWLGTQWSSKTTIVFQILSVGLLFNSLSIISGNLFDGLGRPDLRAKIFISYILPYLLLLWLLTEQFGISGAALAFTLRAIFNSIVFFYFGWRITNLSRDVIRDNRLYHGIMSYSGLVLITYVLLLLIEKTFFFQSIAIVICLLFFFIVIWKFVLDSEDKKPLLLVLNSFVGQKE